MNDDSEKLPLEYPLRESLRIYAGRLAIFFAIALLNFILLGFVLLVARFPSQFSSTTVLMLTLLAIAIYLFVVLTPVYRMEFPQKEYALPRYDRAAGCSFWLVLLILVPLIIVAILFFLFKR